LITEAGVGKTLNWYEEAEEAFISIRRKVHECPKLYFMDEVSPIHLRTDASRYGMGAYLYQVKEDGTEYPVGFISKSFDERMGKWSTIQQEGYAIYYAIKHWDYLLRDRHFFLRTDHDNLTRLKAESDVKVVRWMLAIQDFDFEIKHIAGKDNEVADALSRLCPNLIDSSAEPKVLDQNTPVQSLCVTTKKINRGAPDGLSTPTAIPQGIKPMLADVADLKEICQDVHNDTCGHHGIERTICLLKETENFKTHLNRPT
jgi:hypothetical protein